jgi:hypothetical protein
MPRLQMVNAVHCALIEAMRFAAVPASQNALQAEDLRAALAEVELLLDHCDEPTVWREKWAHVLGPNV